MIIQYGSYDAHQTRRGWWQPRLSFWCGPPYPTFDRSLENALLNFQEQLMNFLLLLWNLQILSSSIKIQPSLVVTALLFNSPKTARFICVKFTFLPLHQTTSQTVWSRQTANLLEAKKSNSLYATRFWKVEIIYSTHCEARQVEWKSSEQFLPGIECRGLDFVKMRHCDKKCERGFKKWRFWVETSMSDYGRTSDEPSSRWN